MIGQYLQKLQQGIDPHRSMMNKKGGGGSGQRAATAEEKRLWAAQADSLEQMTAISMPNLYTGMNNLGVMANESMNGTLATRMRNQAGADASAAMGQGLTGATQHLDRYGSTMNPNAMAAQMHNMALQGAAQKGAAMNSANVAAEDMKWNRNAALTGLASGQGAQAINGMGSLANQIGQNRMQANATDAQSQQGYGMMGAYLMGKAFKDGGEVKLANGGGLQMYKPQAMPTSRPWTFSGGDEAKPDGGVASTVMNTAVGVGVPAMGINLMAKGLDKIGVSAPKQAIDGFYDQAGRSLRQAFTPTQAPAEVTTAVDGATGEAANNLVVDKAAEVGAEKVAEIGAEKAVEGVVADGAATAAGGGSFMGALGTAMPWLAGGYAIGSLLGLWAGGGPVSKGVSAKRQDLRPGGEVSGPGTETSDSIPARLSDGEFVLNADAVKMVGMDKLNAINNMGLQQRQQRQQAPTETGVALLARGGLVRRKGC